MLDLDRIVFTTTSPHPHYLRLIFIAYAGRGWAAKVPVGEVEAGFACVALMGSSMSTQQEELMAGHFKSACLMLDGDDTRRSATNECLVRLGRRMWVLTVELPDGRQPDQLSEEQLRRLLG
jgi:hypothetical protein